MQLCAPSRLALAALLVACTSPAWANGLQLTLKDGRVTLSADNVPARRILEEWAKVGDTHIVNVDKVGGPPLTLRLEDVPEQQALDIVLRSAAGYLVAPRPDGEPGSSRFDRIFILAASKAPPAPGRSGPSATPPTFAAPPTMGDEQYEADDTPEPGQMPQLQPYPGPFPGTVQPAQGQEQTQQPFTSPRPGFAPVPQSPPGNVTPLPPGYPSGVVQPITPPRKPGGGGTGG